MRYSALILSVAVIFSFVASGCGSSDRITDPGLKAPASIQKSTGQTNTHLWGFYDVYIDIPTQTAHAELNRNAMFTANVVNFLNKSAAGLKFKINVSSVFPDYIDVDIDVTITHPFPGLPQYNGYDVRGVFMGDGSAQLDSTDVFFAMPGVDQIMLTEPSPDFPPADNGASDGYTRWFNKPEFSEGGLPLFQYTQGKKAPISDPSATINAYKYFADGLGANEDVWTWLENNADSHGVFSSGSSNTRNYWIRFPNGKVKWPYAILADWTGMEPQYHPSNAEEAVASKVDDSSNVYYVSPTENGGSLVLDISLYDWHGQPSSITVESSVLSAPHELDASEMVPVDSGENYSTWHTEIPADNVQSVDGNYYFIIAEYSAYNYKNDFNTPNLAENESLTAYFKYDLDVSSNPTNQDPVCDLVSVTSMPAKGWDVGVPVEFDASGSSDPDGDPLTFQWDFDGDGIYGENPDDSYTGDPDNPVHIYTADYSGEVCVKVSDGKGGVSECCIDVEVITVPSKNIPLRNVVAFDIAINPADGDLLVLYSDGQIWKHTAAEFYQTGTAFKDLASDFGSYQDLTGLDWLDIAPNNAIVITGKTTGDQNRLAYYLEDGTPDPCGIYPGSSFVIFDAYAFGDTGTFANDAGYSFGWEWSGGHYTQIERHEDPEYCQTHFMSYIFYGSNYTGPEKIYAPYCVAVETDKYGDYMWFLENTDWYASRWLATGTGIYGDLVYDNAYFGTGSQTDNDNGWNDGKDIARDDQNRYFVLDRLSDGSPRVKMWTVSGSTTDSKGGFGDSTSIDGDPLRIEGSDCDGNIVVLHGTSLPYKISVFLPVEMPG